MADLFDNLFMNVEPNIANWTPDTVWWVLNDNTMYIEPVNPNELFETLKAFSHFHTADMLHCNLEYTTGRKYRRE